MSVRTGDSILTSPAFAKGNGKGDRRSLGFEPGVSLASPGIGPAPDRAPLTLTEKYVPFCLYHSYMIRTLIVSMT